MFPVSPIGLRGRFILLLLAAFAMIFTMIALHTVAHRAEKIADASTHLLGNAKLVAARQQRIVAQADAILNGLMLRPELLSGDSAEDCSRVLAERLKQEKEFVQIGKVLPDGEVACTALPPPDHVNFADRNWFQQALASEKLVVGDVVMGRIVGKPVTVLAKAMRDDAGRATGVVYVSLNLAWLQQQLAEAGLPEDSRLVVVDANGTVVARHPEHDGWLGRSAAQTPLFQTIAARKGPGTVEGPGLEGKPRLIAFTPLLETVSGPMTLWLSAPKAAVMAPVQHELVTNLSLTVTVLLLALGLAFWGGEKLLLRPLLTLSRTAARFGEGDLGARSGLPHGSDEIGRLARTLDETAAAIEDREHRLARANRALRVLSAGNRALLRCKTEQELGQEMCRAIVEAGGYRLAWVGYASDDKRVQPVASWNAAGDFFDGLKITWDETESGQGPTGTAIRLGNPIASNNLQTDPEYAPWRERAQRHGYAASLALPLRVDGTVIGALNIYAAEPDAFDEGVIELLGESAADLAFGITTLRDEVEQKRTQAALHAAEAQFRAVAEASLDALFILRSVRGEHGEILDFEFTDLNPRAEQMLDMPRDKVVGQKLCELLPVNRSGGFFDKYVTVATTGTPMEEEFPIDVPEIKAKWLRHQVVQVGDGIAISSRDITQWKKMSAEIRRQGKLRKQIMSSVGEGIFGLDTEGRATFVNSAATAMLQWTEKELIGQPMHTLHHHTRADGTPYPGKECPIYEAYRDGKVHRVDTEVFWRKDGTSYPVEYVSTPILDDQGVLTGAVVSFTDISARKQAEQILHDSEERFRVTIENIRDAFVLINSEDERILLWNPAAEEMFGYSQEEIIGQPMHQLIVPPRFHEAAYAGLARFTQTGEGAAVGRTNELMALRRDGTEFPVEMALSAMQIGGKWHAAGLVRDISQRKAQEQALTRSVRTLKTLSEINQALVRANDEAQLLQEVCQGIVEKGGYRMAWVAFADDNPEKTITAKAWAGTEEDYLTRLHLTWADTERGQGPTSRAIRSGEMQTTHDIRSDPGFALWRELAEEHGFRSNFSYPLTVAGKVIGALGIYAAEVNAFDETETQLLTELGGDLAFGIETLRTRIQRDHIAHQHKYHAEILRHSLEDSLRAIATTVEMRDPYTAGHERRVGELAVAIAQEMGLDEDKIHGIRLAASVHDLGKINVPAEILSKPGKLSDIEFMLIKTHAQAGYDILKDVEFPWPIADIVWQHHERLDGTGYPQGLSNGSILLESRIMAVADVVEAMASHRPYRPGLGIDTALGEIERGKGSAYDPAVADACLKLFSEGRFSWQV